MQRVLNKIKRRAGFTHTWRAGFLLIRRLLAELQATECMIDIALVSAAYAIEVTAHSRELDD